jgi:cyclophilin family peptidyl-prolyl cis-trans isomerase
LYGLRLTHPPPQFFITTAKCEFLDGKHVVFGKVIDGMLTLRKIEAVQTGPNNRPKLVVKITGASAFPLILTCNLMMPP